MNLFRKRHVMVACTLISTAALLAACTGVGPIASSRSPSSTTVPATSASSTAPSPDPRSAPSGGTPDDCAAYAAYGSHPGTSVSMYSGIVAPQDVPHIQSFANFERCTGITVEFQGESEFDTQIHVRIQGGNPPDVAVFAQPGVIKQLAEAGDLVAAPVAVAENVREFWSEAWAGYVTLDGTLYGAPMGANVKSLVWYSPQEFTEQGYEIPQSLEELRALSEQIAATGKRPWCAGIGSGDATGWPVTDWMEDLMLRLSGAETYDEWVAHSIPFNGSDATAALDAAGEYLKNPDFVNGGFGDVTSIASTAFQDAGLPILEGQCSLHRQGSFYGEIWPAGTQIAEDGDVFAFYFPAADDTAKPVLGGGEFMVAFADRPEVQAFQAFMSSAMWANEKVASTPSGGWVSANTGLDVSKLSDPIDRLSAEILLDPAAVFRYDGSDQMPAAVGVNSFWTESTEWITGQSTQETLDAIEESWPTP